jgi:hypothetical protein
MRCASSVALLSLTLLTCGTLSAADRFSGYEGTAFELSSGKMIYVESHYLHFVDDKAIDRVVLYRCPNGKPFGRKILNVKGKPQMPEFELVDQRLGYRGFDGVLSNIDQEKRKSRTFGWQPHHGR